MGVARNLSIYGESGRWDMANLQDGIWRGRMGYGISGWGMENFEDGIYRVRKKRYGESGRYDMASLENVIWIIRRMGYGESGYRI